MGKRVLLVSEYCKYCDEARDVLRQDLIAGKILLINIDSNREGREMARMFGGVPTLVEEENGEVHELKMF